MLVGCKHLPVTGLTWLSCPGGAVSPDQTGTKLACTYNLQFDGLAIQLDGADLEVHSDGADVAFSVGVILQTWTTAALQTHAAASATCSSISEMENLLQSAAGGRTFLLQSPRSAGA